MEINLHNIIQVNVMNMEIMVLKKMKLKHLNGIKNQLNKNMSMHNVRLDGYMAMVLVQERIQENLFIGFKKQQEMAM